MILTIKHLFTVSRHAECQALLHAAGFASVSIHTVHHTVLLPGTLVVDHEPRTLKETFAGFARDHGRHISRLQTIWDLHSAK